MLSKLHAIKHGYLISVIILINAECYQRVIGPLLCTIVHSHLKVFVESLISKMHNFQLVSDSHDYEEGVYNKKKGELYI